MKDKKDYEEEKYTLNSKNVKMNKSMAELVLDSSKLNGI
jgi:hypothetical protein